MNNNDFLTQLNEYLSQINEIADKANKLAEEYTASEQAVEEHEDKAKSHTEYMLDVLSDYVDAFDDEMYWVECGDIGYGYVAKDDEDIFTFDNFPTEEYAKKLQKLNKFNGMMLAFKYCYDRDYKSDFYDDNTYKYTVVWDMANKFHHYITTVTWLNQVFFSSEDIAKKCAEWLNKIDPEGELVK